LPSKIDLELTHHQYFRAQLEEALPDADEETQVDTLEGLSDPTETFSKWRDFDWRHSDDLARDSYQRVHKFMQCSARLSSLCSSFDHLLFHATCSLWIHEEATNA